MRTKIARKRRAVAKVGTKVAPIAENEVEPDRCPPEPGVCASISVLWTSRTAENKISPHELGSSDVVGDHGIQPL
jgi:hypothetical protein